ncbi:hypothetical protein ACHWQZ_G018791 [Mnemiopsis leidyi]
MFTSDSSLGQAKSVLMIVSSTCSDIMVALPGLIGEIIVVADTRKQSLEPSSTECKVQSLFTSVGAQVSIIWTAGLAQHMFILVACRKEAVKAGFMVLIAMTGAVVAENVYLYYVDILGGGAKMLGMKWCWIKIDDENMRNCNWMLWNGKVLEITMYVAVFIYYFLLYTKVNHLKNRNDLASTSLVTVISKTGKIVAIPFVFVLVRLWGTLASLWWIKTGCQRAPTESALFNALLVLMSFFDMSQGWVNFILYFLTTQQEFNLADRLKLVLRSVPYMTKTRRAHCSENSYLTYNESGGGRRSRSSLTVGNTLSSSRGGGSRTYSSSPKIGHCLQIHGQDIGQEL